MSGYPPSLAFAAEKNHIPVEKIDLIAQLMRETGMWDGRDRRKIDEILGWDDHGQLHVKRWMKMPAEQLRPRLAKAAISGRPAIQVLYDDYDGTGRLSSP